MKVDFHCHTRATKDGESKSRNVSSENFKKSIINAGVKMVAITNHNEFDRENYDLLHNIAGDDFLVFPGIELDVNGIDKERGHVVIIYDDNDVDTFDLKVKEIINGMKPDNFSIDIDKLISFLNNINCIVMAHFHKPDALNETSINKIRENIIDNYRFFYEPSSYRTLGIMINNDFRALKGSDIVDWNNYESQEFANIKLDIDSYKNLMLFMKKDKTIIESLLNRQTQYHIDIAYKKDYKEIVNFYDNINIFFGTKGTGKSVSLNKIKKHFENLSKDISYYSPDTTQEKINEKLKVEKSERDLSIYNQEKLEDIFKFISSWTLPDVTQFIDYYNYIKFNGKNKNKAKMKILTINYLIDYNEKNLEKVKQDYNNSKRIKTILSQIDISSYLDEKELEILNHSIESLHSRILKKYSEEFSLFTGTTLSNHCVESIKQSVEKNTETKTVPSGTGFKAFSKSLFKLENNIIKIFNGLNFSYESENEYVGKLEENKKLYKKTILTMLNDDSKAEDGFLQIKKLKAIRKCLIDIIENIYKTEIIEYVNEYKRQYNDFDELSLNDFVAVVKRFVLNNDYYTPSTGEATMILLDETLQSNHDVYILDEPEKSLGNNYISEVLVPKLNDLAKLKKVVIIATHNANIAVRTFPYCSILKTYYNDIYNTYVGNPYTNQLININDAQDIKSWKNESINILEGGRAAFDERSDIYE